jgi:hypothetical protein
MAETQRLTREQYVKVIGTLKTNEKHLALFRALYECRDNAAVQKDLCEVLFKYGFVQSSAISLITAVGKKISEITGILPEKEPGYDGPSYFTLLYYPVGPANKGGLKHRYNTYPALCEALESLGLV